MNYKNLYENIINTAKTRNFVFEYGEKHHIIPRCLGGDNKKQNIVKLTAKEHFICHYLLVKIYPNNEKIFYAFWGMCNQKNKKVKRDYKISSRLYEKARKQFSEKFSGENHPNFGKTPSQEARRKASEKLKGENNPNFGKSINAKWYLLLDVNNSELVIKNIYKFKNDNTNKTFKKFPDKYKNVFCKRVDFRFVVLEGYEPNLPENEKQFIIEKHKKLIKEIGPISPWNIGIKTNEHTKEKISNSLKGRKPWNTGIETNTQIKKKISESLKGKKPWNFGLKFKKQEN